MGQICIPRYDPGPENVDHYGGDVIVCPTFHRFDNETVSGLLGFGGV
jgi:hypothetical protein